MTNFLSLTICLLLSFFYFFFSARFSCYLTPSITSTKFYSRPLRVSFPFKQRSKEPAFPASFLASDTLLRTPWLFSGIATVYGNPPSVLARAHCYAFNFTIVCVLRVVCVVLVFFVGRSCHRCRSGACSLQRFLCSPACAFSLF